MPNWQRPMLDRFERKVAKVALKAGPELSSGNILVTALGAAYGTAKSGTGIAAMSVMRPELIMKSIIPVVMAGIIAIYGLVVAVLIAGSLEEPPKYKLYK
uniref:V-type proton ATPase 16 kDa proteolipid subunit c n=1 Tax=Timema shepardi TaxID=629360 RepID=A0A7R9G873_TIMSH|nr:unnamed protein product [Timema shepardi]